jgi:iron complex outermembrane receptor protein
VFRKGGFDLTIDGYLIKMRDQLGLSENITCRAADQALLACRRPASSSMVCTPRPRASTSSAITSCTASVGTFDLTAAANINKITVDSYPTSSLSTLFARQRILTITDGTPGEKLVGSVDWSFDKLGATARASYYGNVIQPSTAAGDLSTGRKTIIDLEARYKVLPMASLSVGANNVFDIYPKQTPANLLATNGAVAFPYYSPWGFNGRYLYAKLSLNW